MRDLEVAHTDFTGQTYQRVLLPLWIGAYHYHQQLYRVLVNGQTLKVAGVKPVDWVKVGLMGLALAAALRPLGVLLVAKLSGAF